MNDHLRGALLLCLGIIIGMVATLLIVRPVRAVTPFVATWEIAAQPAAEEGSYGANPVQAWTASMGRRAPEVQDMEAGGPDMRSVRMPSNSASDSEASSPLGRLPAAPTPIASPQPPSAPQRAPSAAYDRDDARILAVLYLWESSRGVNCPPSDPWNCYGYLGAHPPFASREDAERFMLAKLREAPYAGLDVAGVFSMWQSGSVGPVADPTREAAREVYVAASLGSYGQQP